MALKKEFKKKWVAALRSGKYKQGKGRLAADGRHCCLGVACEVMGVEYLGSAGIPSNATLKKMGLHPLHAAMLADLNDSGQTSGITDDKQYSLPAIRYKTAGFKRIARYIELNL